MVLQFVFENILIIGLGVAFGFILWKYLKVSRGFKYKIIDRKEVERLNFIEKMQFNVAHKFKWLYRADLVDFTEVMPNGNRLLYQKLIKIDKDHAILNNNVKKFKNGECLGKIVHYMEFEQKPYELIKLKDGTIELKEEKNGENVHLIAMTLKPIWFWKFTNPFKKLQPLIIENNTELGKDEKNKRLMISFDIATDNLFGIYYELSENSKPKHRNIVDSRLTITDWNLTASRYFVKGQEQCVYSPEMAQQMAIREKEIQLELAKKRGKQETI